MTGVVPDILSRIVKHKQEELLQRRSTSDRLESLADARRSDRRDFAAALRTAPPSIIAECKKASPSKGTLVPDYYPPRLAASYQEGGAAALSVLTDEKFFQGSLADLESARASVRLPVLRKDFTLDSIHVLEAAAHGADAILLIAAILSTLQLRSLREQAERLGMAALVEVHNEDELRSALDAGAHLLGVNNRDLHTFQVSIETSLRLAERMPPGATLVSESGITSAADVRRLREAGYHAFLVGEHLVRSGSPAAAIRELRS
ncbi:MAG: indole-3-glycerol phosphate synthase TrpC [Bryobacteraceae bacterium]|nr:indole-3-glycerol phosphate synthase TrpC [Bryobacteraceae bacterium]